MIIKTITNSTAETKKLGQRLVKDIIKKNIQTQAVIIGLIGELGSGKTCFTQGFANGLDISNKILSPTYVILKRFQISGSMFHDFYHIDCYRIKAEKEILDLGFANMCQNPENIIVIEWADQIKEILPKQTLFLKFKFINKNKREIKSTL
ncbi:MAG: tRNA (adenosine(37)-N6)-threonylcarbamoyltransferase complex ATPase subunit type 1 TsaE [Candidatus Pacebacteria bacterium]|nr:tRNA (adenosine(37)-N6)-threonylcarbamoyltransferase complex ATPase subunit type 1 TsaE [Candidatus Paceibacterota bacterium]